MDCLYDLVVSDLDGTLVQKDLLVSESVRAAFWSLSQHSPAKGVIATGRMFPSAQPYAPFLSLSTPVICYQGALVRESQAPFETRYAHPLPMDVARAVLSYTQAQGYHLNMYVADVLYTPEHPVYVEEYKATSSIEPVIVPDVLPHLTEAPPKLVMIDNDPSRLQALRHYLMETFGADVLTCCLSRHNFLEITASHTSKWAAVQALASQWGIPLNRVLCIGDEENDLSMIAGANAAGGCGVAMGQAPDAVKAAATWIAPSISDEGAAEAIARFVLQRPLNEVVASYRAALASEGVSAC